jgi:predicted lipid-binding transport protein (Tim44 family)
VPIDLIFYAIIAGVLVVWLRNTLGTKTGHERDRSGMIDQLMAKQQGQKPAPAGSIIDITDHVVEIKDPTRAMLEGIEFEGENTVQDILQLMKEDSSFDPKAFVVGAKDAFPMIVEAFSRGDLPVLKMLLSESVYSSFEQAIEDRVSKGETIVTDVHAVRQCKILDIKKSQRMVYIKMRFIADETILVRDKEGHVISGHPDKIVVMNDVWTFGRDVRAKDMTWYLYETSDDVIDECPNPIPDSK